MKRELRFSNLEPAVDGKRSVSGYAAIFGGWSNNLGGFKEKIAPGAFARSASGSDVVALFNHDNNQVLGRTVSGTLQLHEDGTGLAFKVNLPDTQLGRDVHTLVKRGDIRGCSFGFVTIRDAWNSEGNERTLLDVDLFDVSLVTFPAYPQTSVAARSDGQEYGSIGFYDSFRIPFSNGPRPSEIDLQQETLRGQAELLILKAEVGL